MPKTSSYIRAEHWASLPDLVSALSFLRVKQPRTMLLQNRGENTRPSLTQFLRIRVGHVILK